MNQVRGHYLEVCEDCVGPLDPKTCEETSPPTRCQTFELPEIKPIATEHLCHELGCLCGHKIRAKLPDGAELSQFGLRVHGAVGYLSSVHRIGRRGIVEIMNTLFGLGMCVGSVCNCIDRLSPELAPVVEEVRETLPGSANLNSTLMRPDGSAKEVAATCGLLSHLWQSTSA
jgi:hypothetical protein